MNFDTPITSRKVTKRAICYSDVKAGGLSSSLKNSAAGPGRPLLFDPSLPISTYLSNRIIDPMSERTYLQENEIEVLICLLKVYSRALRKEEPRQIRREEIPEIFLEGGILDLSGRKSLSSSEDRLLGQLSVIKFRTKSDAEPVSLLNFPKCMPISIIRLPQQRKLGDKKHNNRLYSAQIKTGKKWIEHLSGSFNDELISNLFLQIKDDQVETAVKNTTTKTEDYQATTLVV